MGIDHHYPGSTASREGPFESAVSGRRLKVVDGSNTRIVAVGVKRNDRNLISGFPFTVETGYAIGRIVCLGSKRNF